MLAFITRLEALLVHSGDEGHSNQGGSSVPGLVLCMDCLIAVILTLQVHTFSFPIWKGEMVANEYVIGFWVVFNVCWNFGVHQYLSHINIKLECSLSTFPSLNI